MRQFPEPIYYSAAAALIARLGEVPAGFESRRHGGLIPDFAADAGIFPKGDEMELREFVRSSETLHPTLCQSIEAATLKLPFSEEQLNRLAAEGAIGSLVAVALSFSYGVAPNVEWIIRYLRYSEKWSEDMRQRQCLDRLSQCWRHALGAANKSNEFRVRLIEALDHALTEQDVNFFSVAKGIFGLRNGFVSTEVKQVLAYYADHPAYYDYSLSLPMSRWIIRDSVPEERPFILEELERTITSLDEWAWKPESNKRTCYPLLLFPAVLWILSNTNSPSEVSMRVFLRGLRHLFTVSGDGRNTHAGSAEVEEPVTIASDITNIVQEIPPPCLKQVIATGAMSDDVVVRTISRFFKLN